MSAALALAAPLARDSDFQAAWYYSIIVFAAVLLAGYGMFLCVRPLGRMWRAGDHALAVTVAVAVLVAFLMYVSMLITVAIALLPAAYHGGAG